MSVPFPATEELFTVVVRKHLNAAPDKMWRNTYEFYNRGGGTAEQLLEIADVTVEFEAMLTLNNATIDQVTISTWVPDDTPYDPMSFVSIPFTTLGALPLGTNQPLDLDVCWYIRRDVSFGRTGKLFFRSALTENDVLAVGGKWSLADPATKQGLLETALTDSTFNQYIIGDSPYDLVMVGVVPDASGFGRDVIGLTSAGAKNVKMNHVYYDLGTEADDAMVAAFAAKGVTVAPGQRVKLGRRVTKRPVASVSAQEGTRGVKVVSSRPNTAPSGVEVLDSAKLPKAKG